RWPRDWSSDVCSSDLGNLFSSIDFRTDTLVAQWPQLRQTKIENLHAAVRSDKKIFGLEIAMSDPTFMRRCQTLSNLLRIVERLEIGRASCRESVEWVD